jgi:cbb3-type cytochrome oxidase cytochrome c subunit
VNQRFAVLLATAAVALAVPLAATVAEEAAKSGAEVKIPAGQKLFLDNSCNSCHTMKGQGIEKKKSATATEATAATPAAAPSKVPDLSAVGLEHDQAWMTKFLMKTETLHDKKHMKTWKGTEADLATLTAWLAEQKNAEAAGLKTDKAAKEADAAAQKADEAAKTADEAKQEAKDAKQTADKAADQAKDAQKDAEKAKDQSK